MPQVPYQPFSTVAPSSAGTPSVNIATPEAAFGGAVAHAVNALGKDISGAGDEIFKRAMALQELQNESDARQATTDYMIHAGKLHADFSALQGKAAVDAYPKYMKDLQESRVQFQGSLGNDQARKMYDRESMSTMGRSIFNGAGHAAQQGKVYAAGTAQAEIDATNDYIHHNPEDENAMRMGMTKAIQLTRDVKAPIAGWGPEQTNVAIAKERSGLVLNQITGLAKEKPFKAQELLDQHREDLFGPDLQKAEDVVRGQMHTTQARIISNSVNAPTEEGEEKTLKQVTDEAGAKAKEQRPDDPIFHDIARNTAIGDYNKNRQIKTDTDRQNQETVAGGIIAGAGNIDALRADPKVAAAIAALPAKKQADIPGQIRRYTAAADKETEKASYFRIMGLSETNPSAFLAIDPTQEKLAKSDMKKIWNMQAQRRKNAEGDPQVRRALTDLSPILNNPDLKLSKKDDPEAYNTFVGALQDVVHYEIQRNGGKAPTYDEIQLMGKRLLTQFRSPNWLFGNFWPNKSDPMFKLKPPQEVIDGTRKQMMDTNPDVYPEDEEVTREYVRQQYMQTFGRQGK